MALPKRILVQEGEFGNIIKDNLTATIPPTTNDDGTKSYSYTSEWIVDNTDIYKCLDNTAGAAVWVKLNP